jgi:transcriptional antiterminator NusG
MLAEMQVKLGKGEVSWRDGRAWKSRPTETYFLEMLGGADGEPKFVVPEKFEGTWLVAQVEPQQERAAAAGLIGRRFAAYLPMRKRRVRGLHPHHHREVEAPLLPGYVFTRCPRERWEYVRSVAGVLDVLGDDVETAMGFERRPMPVALSDLHRIRDKELELATGTRILRVDDTPIQIGDKVSLEDGPFASFSGKVIELLFNREQVKVEIDLFGRKTPVTTEVAMLRVL